MELSAAVGCGDVVVYWCCVSESSVEAGSDVGPVDWCLYESLGG